MDYSCCRGPDPVGDKSGRGSQALLDVFWRTPSTNLSLSRIAFRLLRGSRVARRVGVKATPRSTPRSDAEAKGFLRYTSVYFQK